MFGTIMLFFSAISASLALGTVVLYFVQRRMRNLSHRETAIDEKSVYRDT
jgi:uncharacterized protein HemX